MAKRKTPANLGIKASKLWQETVKNYELAEHEYGILEDACRERDLIDQLENELVGAPLISQGSMGQDVANPLLSEIRMHRKEFVSLMKALALPEIEEVGAQDRSSRARAAANARWGN